MIPSSSVYLILHYGISNEKIILFKYTCPIIHEL